MNNSSKWPIWNLCISSHLEAKNINFGQQVNKGSIVYSCSGSGNVISS